MITVTNIANNEKMMNLLTIMKKITKNEVNDIMITNE